MDELFGTKVNSPWAKSQNTYLQRKLDIQMRIYEKDYKSERRKIDDMKTKCEKELVILRAEKQGHLCDAGYIKNDAFGDAEAANLQRKKDHARTCARKLSSAGVRRRTSMGVDNIGGATTATTRPGTSTGTYRHETIIPEHSLNSACDQTTRAATPDCDLSEKDKVPFVPKRINQLRRDTPSGGRLLNRQKSDGPISRVYARPHTSTGEYGHRHGSLNTNMSYSETNLARPQTSAGEYTCNMSRAVSSEIVADRCHSAIGFNESKIKRPQAKKSSALDQALPARQEHTQLEVVPKSMKKRPKTATPCLRRPVSKEMHMEQQKIIDENVKLFIASLDNDGHVENEDEKDSHKRRESENEWMVNENNGSTSQSDFNFSNVYALFNNMKTQQRKDTKKADDQLKNDSEETTTTTAPTMYGRVAPKPIPTTMSKNGKRFKGVTRTEMAGFKAEAAKQMIVTKLLLKRSKSISRYVLKIVEDNRGDKLKNKHRRSSLKAQ